MPKQIVSSLQTTAKHNLKLLKLTSLTTSLVLLIVSLLLVVSLLAAEQEAAPQNLGVADQLAQIEQTVSRVTTELANIRGHLSALQQEEQRLNSTLANVRKRESNINLEYNKIAEQLSKSQSQLEYSRNNHRQLISDSAGRLLAAYVYSRNRNNLLLYSNQQVEWHKLSFYSGKTREQDLRLMSAIQQSADELAKEQQRLSTLVTSHDNVKAKLQKEKSNIEALLGKQRKLLNQVRSRERESEKKVTELQAQSLRLETVMVSMTEGGEQNFYKREQIPGRLGGEKSLSFVGAGLQPLKGTLEYPTNNAKPMSTKEAGIKTRGVYFRADSAEEVKVITTGQVVFSGRMPGYDNTVIIDHGQRYYSVYGKLSSVMAEKGDILPAGKVIGKAGVRSDGLGQVYFEIRQAGNAVDPLPYFR